MKHACDKCLTRARLIAALAGRIETMTGSSKRSVRLLLALGDDELLTVLGVGEDERGPTKAAARAAAAADREVLIDGGAVCAHSEFYPERLRHLHDPPAAVYFTGPLARFLELAGAENPVAIVGTRRASQPGRHAAYSLGRGIAAAGLPVISGLAFGIDAAAHRGAVDTDGPVLAVLGSGADAARPVGNRPLYNRVRATGTVVSELPWGQKPFRWTFPARNRIMAALATMTVVVEAASQSGSLITAEFALGLGREVGAVPGTPHVSITEGTNDLINDGARIIREPRDVVEQLYGVSDGAARLAAAARREPGDPRLVAVLDAVTLGAPLEEARERSGLTPRELRSALVRLEHGGFIRRAGLRGYERIDADGPQPKLQADPNAGRDDD